MFHILITINLLFHTLFIKAAIFLSDYCTKYKEDRPPELFSGINKFWFNCSANAVIVIVLPCLGNAAGTGKLCVYESRKHQT